MEKQMADHWPLGPGAPQGNPNGLPELRPSQRVTAGFQIPSSMLLRDHAIYWDAEIAS
jgi:hypothetical protein